MKKKRKKDGQKRRNQRRKEEYLHLSQRIHCQRAILLIRHDWTGLARLKIAPPPPPFPPCLVVHATRNPAPSRSDGGSSQPQSLSCWRYSPRPCARGDKRRGHSPFTLPLGRRGSRGGGRGRGSTLRVRVCLCLCAREGEVDSRGGRGAVGTECCNGAAGRWG